MVLLVFWLEVLDLGIKFFSCGKRFALKTIGGLNVDKDSVRDHDSIRHMQQNRLHIRYRMYTFV